MARKKQAAEPQVTNSFEALGQTQLALVKKIPELPVKIKTDAQQAGVVEIVARAAKVRKDCDSMMKEATKPLKAQVKTIEGAWRPIIATATAIGEQGKEIIQRYLEEKTRARVAQLQARDEALAAANAAYDAAEQKLEDASTIRQKNAALAKIEAAQDAIVEASAVPAPVATSMQTEAGTVSMRGGRWTYEVDDLGHIPPRFMAPNHRAIMEAIQGGVREIPGLRIYQQQQMVVRES